MQFKEHLHTAMASSEAKAIMDKAFIRVGHNQARLDLLLRVKDGQTYPQISHETGIKATTIATKCREIRGKILDTISEIFEASQLPHDKGVIGKPSLTILLDHLEVVGYTRERIAELGQLLACEDQTDIDTKLLKQISQKLKYNSRFLIGLDNILVTILETFAPEAYAISHEAALKEIVTEYWSAFEEEGRRDISIGSIDPIRLTQKQYFVFQEYAIAKKLLGDTA